jgi:hypothetical protein
VCTDVAPGIAFGVAPEVVADELATGPAAAAMPTIGSDDEDEEVDAAVGAGADDAGATVKHSVLSSVDSGTVPSVLWKTSKKQKFPDEVGVNVNAALLPPLPSAASVSTPS